MSTITETGRVIPTGTWTLDPVHSTIGFEIDYLVGAFKGQFDEVEATLVDDGQTTQLAGSAPVAGVAVKDENLEAHLQTPDFFDAERHPRLSFESTSIEGSPENVTIRGEITIKGVTRPLQLTGTLTQPATDPYGNERIGLKVATTLSRSNFGIDWNVPLPDGGPALADEVRLSADLYFVRQA
jgi:polyisoprenoid-binding protein YceI